MCGKHIIICLPRVKALIFQVAGIPVVIKRNVTLKTQAAGSNLAGRLSATATLSGSMQMGVVYDKSTGWKQQIESKSQMQLSAPNIRLPSDSGVQTARLYVIPELGFSFYGFIELLVKPKLYAHLTMQSAANGVISLPATHSTETGYIYVQLQRAKVTDDWESGSGTESNEVYVKVNVNGQVKQSRTQNDNGGWIPSRKHKYDEVFKFSVPANTPTTSITFEVYEQDSLSLDDIVGYAKSNCDPKLTAAAACKELLTISSKRYGGLTRGKLLVKSVWSKTSLSSSFFDDDTDDDKDWSRRLSSPLRPPSPEVGSLAHSQLGERKLGTCATAFQFYWGLDFGLGLSEIKILKDFGLSKLGYDPPCLMPEQDFGSLSIIKPQAFGSGCSFCSGCLASGSFDGAASPPTPYPTASPTPSPTGYPTAYPTGSPTKSPTTPPVASPTRFPTAYPTPSPTSFPTSSPTRFPTKRPTYPQTCSAGKSYRVTLQSGGTMRWTCASATSKALSYSISDANSDDFYTVKISDGVDCDRLPGAGLLDYQSWRKGCSSAGCRLSDTHTRSWYGGRACLFLTCTNAAQDCDQIQVQIGFNTPRPTAYPTASPTQIPTQFPTSYPTANPTNKPTAFPTTMPTNFPTPFPTSYPSAQPTSRPTPYPTTNPTPFPTGRPTPFPSSSPTRFPTAEPSTPPVAYPTFRPTPYPTSTPSPQPTPYPTTYPTSNPTPRPTSYPSSQPTRDPTSAPTPFPTANPTTSQPTGSPTHVPSPFPTARPTVFPTALPTRIPVDCASRENCRRTCAEAFNYCDADGGYYCCEGGSKCTESRTCASDPGLLDCACPAPTFAWVRVTPSMIGRTIQRQTNVIVGTDTDGGARIQNVPTSRGCGDAKGGAASTTQIVGSWTKIRYTQEFSGRVSCWAIFGATLGGSHSVGIASSNLQPIDNAAGDKVWLQDMDDEKVVTSSTRCDNTADNFWHSNSGGAGAAKATVELRRSDMNAEAGLGTFTSCVSIGSTNWTYSDIWIWKPLPTASPTPAPSMEPTSVPSAASPQNDQSALNAAADQNAKNTGSAQAPVDTNDAANKGSSSSVGAAVGGTCAVLALAAGAVAAVKWRGKIFARPSEAKTPDGFVQAVSIPDSDVHTNPMMNEMAAGAMPAVQNPVLQEDSEGAAKQ